MAPTPGILYVTMQPQPSLPIAKFHDWYNNEHGPTRLRLPAIFSNGFRYRATDLQGEGSNDKPEWMAIYDVYDMADMLKDTYTRLRKDPVQSQRERDTMKQIKVDRRFYDLVGSKESKEFKKLECVGAGEEGNVMVAVHLKPEQGQMGEIDRWFEEEHGEMLSQIPGWLRTRRFVTSSVEGKEEVEREYLVLNEFKEKNGLGGEEHVKATSTEWRNKIMTEVVEASKRRMYGLHYTFGGVPRDLESLGSGDAVEFESTDAKTRTLPASNDNRCAIESYVTTEDGAVLPFRVEGSTDPEAPLIVLSNSVLVEWGIWDGFIGKFLESPEGKKYRILRYHTRGRSSSCGNQAVTVDLLASDIITLLDALRVPKAAAVIGVSLGGATVLNVALKYPDRVAAFVSCDTNSQSPAGNQKAWEERIAIAEKESATGQAGEKVVGEQLAELTVRRWFVKESYDGGSMEKEIERVKKMVQTNSLDGFKKSAQALYSYDLREEMKTSEVKGAFFVGRGDGVLPAGMKQMAAEFGKGADYVVIDVAGHLPMVEKPQDFANAVTKFLSG
jgi:pimeloyl-ACP methyl ester carboxylesterase